MIEELKEYKKKFIEVTKLKQLEDSIGFLSNYKTPHEELHHVGPNIHTEDSAETELLIELGRINIRREELIKKLISS